MSARGLRAHCPELFTGLKRACKGAVTEAGGLKVAAHRLGVGQTEAHNYGNPDRGELPSLMQAAALTRDEGIASFAEFFAWLAGGRFAPRGEAGAEALTPALCDLNAEIAELSFRITTALRDGTTDAGERRDIRRSIADLEEALATAKALLDGAEAG